MLKKLIDLLQGTPKPYVDDAGEPQLPEISPPEEAAAPRNDATRPSYRVGKHKLSDIYKALDMGG